MGVNRLWKLLEDAGQPAEFTGKVLAIDTSIWIHQLSRLEDNQLIFIATKRILKVLHEGITPIFVFDGAVPAQKMETIRRRRRAKHISSDRTEEHDKFEDLPAPTEESMIEMGQNKYKWGDLYASSDSDSTDYKDIASALRTRTSKLRRLFELRSKRRETLPFDARSPENFSTSQIANAMKRNAVTSLIKEVSGPQRIKSDSTRSIEMIRTNAVYREEQAIIEDIVNLEEEFSAVKSSDKESDDVWEEVLTLPQPLTTTPKVPEASLHPTERSSPCNTSANKSSETSESEVEEFLRRSDSSAMSLAMVKLTSRIASAQEKVRNIIKLMGLQTVDSPFEADSQCAKLVLEGTAEGVVSEDNDLLLYGVPTYRNFFKKNKNVLVYTQESICAARGWTRTDLVKISFLLGSDYTPGVAGVGPSRAIKMLSSVSEESIAELEKIYSHPTGGPYRASPVEAYRRHEVLLFFKENNLAKDKRDELIFYIDGMKLENAV